MIPINVKLAGHVRYEVHDANGKLKYSSKLIKNRLVNGFFFNWLGQTGGASTASWQQFQYCQCGTSAVAVTDNDTSITALGPRKSGTAELLTHPTSNSWVSGKKYSFAQNDVIGTVNEFGIFQTAPTGGLMTARVVLPAPVVLVTGDILTVYHYITATINLSDVTGSFTLQHIVAGVPTPVVYNFTGRWLNYNNISLAGSGTPWNISDSLYPINFPSMGLTDIKGRQTLSAPVNPDVSLDTVATAGDVNHTFGMWTATPQAYVASTFYRDIEFFFDISKLNTPLGLGSLVFLWDPAAAIGVGFCITLNQRIPKDNTKELKLVMRFTYTR